MLLQFSLDSEFQIQNFKIGPNQNTMLTLLGSSEHFKSLLFLAKFRQHNNSVRTAHDQSELNEN